MNPIRLQIIDNIYKIYKERLSGNPGDILVNLLIFIISNDKFKIDELEKISNNERQDSEINLLICKNILEVIKEEFSLDSINFIQKLYFQSENSKRRLNTGKEWDEFYYDYVIRELGKLIKQDLLEYSFVSIGCGSGRTESKLDGHIKKNYPNAKIQWIGLDTVQYLQPDSVFKDSFIKLENEEIDSYISILNKIEYKNIWIYANFAVHHMMISPEKFIAKCEGSNRLILIDHLVSAKNYENISFRVAALGYDLISNFLSNPGWEKEFMSGESVFNADYWTFENSSPHFKITSFPSPQSRIQILDKIML